MVFKCGCGAIQKILHAVISLPGEQSHPKIAPSSWGSAKLLENLFCLDNWATLTDLEKGKAELLAPIPQILAEARRIGHLMAGSALSGGLIYTNDDPITITLFPGPQYPLLFVEPSGIPFYPRNPAADYNARDDMTNLG